MNTQNTVYGHLRPMLTIALLFGLAFAPKAQNLIPNPSFENANCPTGYNGGPTQVALYIQDWYSATCASPDPMTGCSSNTGQAVNTSVPGVWFGYQYARTGDNYMGIGWYGGWYEYIGVRLTQPLTAGTEYNVSFYVSCANDAKYATDAIGMYFSNTEIKCTSGFSGPVLTYTPQIVQTPGTFLTDTLGWQQVSGSFTAQGGEEYVVVGYFNPWNVANFQTLGGSAARCYYYLDDFSVEAVANLPVPAQPDSISGLQTVCEGSTQTFGVDSVPGATSYTWTLPNGWTGTSTGNSITTTVGGTAGDITVTADNATGSSLPQTVSVSVNTFPAAPGTVTGPLAVCTGQTAIYSVSAVAGATSYFWNLPAGWSGSSTGTTITVTAGNTGGMLIAGAQNECGTSGSQVALTVIQPQASVTQTNGQLLAATADTYQWVDCNNGYTAVPGETQAIFIPTGSGSYAAAITVNGCSDTSACFSVTVQPSGIAENETASGISVYPNPVQKAIHIMLPQSQITEVYLKLTDLTGKTVYQGQHVLLQSTVTLAVPDATANGIYLLEIRNGDALYYHKIVIEN